MERTAKVTRKTKETDISLSLKLDGTGAASVSTGIGFFDHMLEGFARHGLFDLKVNNYQLRFVFEFSFQLEFFLFLFLNILNI